jgi:hypothetical protein
MHNRKGIKNHNLFMGIRTKMASGGETAEKNRSFAAIVRVALIVSHEFASAV